MTPDKQPLLQGAVEKKADEKQKPDQYLFYKENVFDLLDKLKNIGCEIKEEKDVYDRATEFTILHNSGKKITRLAPRSNALGFTEDTASQFSVDTETYNRAKTQDEINNLFDSIQAKMLQIDKDVKAERKKQENKEQKAKNKMD